MQPTEEILSPRRQERKVGLDSRLRGNDGGPDWDRNLSVLSDLARARIATPRALSLRRAAPGAPRSPASGACGSDRKPRTQTLRAFHALRNIPSKQALRSPRKPPEAPRNRPKTRRNAPGSPRKPPETPGSPRRWPPGQPSGPLVTPFLPPTSLCRCVAFTRSQTNT